MSLPKKISPCPIAEAIVEIRFEPNLPPEVVIGLIYKSFNISFPNFEKLPILQLPEAIRLSDPQFAFQPYYRSIKNNFTFQFGAKVITLNNSGNYVGWNAYYEKLVETIRKVEELGLLKKVLRLGIRYINFFERIDIYKKITLEVNMNNSTLESPRLITRAELIRGKFTGLLQVANNSALLLSNKSNNGSVIDIDISYENSIDTFSEEFPQLLQDGHEEEKKLFFGLLKPEFLKTLNPEY